ncbi:hypothetical protein [Amycolatopsis sp. NPDC004625]|uniref:hypothetical protein n=1 Tax=Amycolatopsis sp. NPDC004625 TaxID=3154670 RepID=UPI0033A944B8
MALASALTELSRQAWRTYTHPASAADDHEGNSEGWRRQGERDAFAKVVPSIRNPNLPDGDHLIVSYVRVEEAVHRVGRVLHAVSDSTLTEHVIVDAEQELAAVEQAELSDLSGRAGQAVLLTRAEASPVQAAARSRLHRGRSRRSADPTMVVHEADGITTLAVETPSLVLERLNAGETPREVVIDLIKSAMSAAEGELADPVQLIQQIKEAAEKAEQHGPGDPELLAGLMPRISQLAPARPAQDLLEDLLDGIRGCWVPYRASAYYDDESDELIDAEFFEAVKEEAALNGERLL